MGLLAVSKEADQEIHLKLNTTYLPYNESVLILQSHNVTYTTFNGFELNPGAFSQPQYVSFAVLLPAKSHSSMDKNNQSETA